MRSLLAFAVVALFQEHFPDHDRVSSARSLSYFGQDLRDSVDLAGSSQRLFSVCSALLNDDSPRAEATALSGQDNSHPDTSPNLPPIQTSPLIRTMGLAAPLLLPLLFLAVWLYLLV